MIARIVYEVDLPAGPMRSIYPFIDFNTEFLVIGNYGDSVSVDHEYCPRCNSKLPLSKSLLPHIKDIHGVHRYRCDQCMYPVDDMYDYTACEDICEAVHQLAEENYDAYQIWSMYDVSDQPYRIIENSEFVMGREILFNRAFSMTELRVEDAYDLETYLEAMSKYDGPLR